MGDLREGWAIVDQDGAYIAVHLGERSAGHFSDEFFKRRGLRVQTVRILAPGEMDAETIERCAEHLERQPSFGDGEWAARHIRALAGGKE